MGNVDHKMPPPDVFYNQTHAIRKVNEKVKISSASFWAYEKKGYIGPDVVLIHGGRQMPGYSEKRIEEIIGILTSIKLMGVQG